MTEILEYKIRASVVERISTFDDMPDSALVDVNEINALVGRSRASIWRDVAEGRLAPPIKIGPNASRWRVGDVRRFMEGGV